MQECGFFWKFEGIYFKYKYRIQHVVILFETWKQIFRVDVTQVKKFVRIYHVSVQYNKRIFVHVP